MTSSRRVAFSFIGIMAACGAVLLFSMTSAKGQVPVSNTVSNTAPGGSAMGNSAAMSGGAGMGSSGAGTGATGSATTDPSGTPMPSFSQTIGVSPVQIGKKPLLVFGEASGGNIDLQRNNLYSLLTEQGANHPLVLDPLSSAKPSFILERLIVLSLTGAAGSSTSGTTGSSSPSLGGRGGEGEGAGGTTQAPAGPNAAQRTVSQVRALVSAEIARGSGRIGGAHLRKLQLLRDSIRSLEQANTIGGAISSALSGAQGAGGRGGSTPGGNDDSKTDPREIFYGRARLLARQADRYVPVSY